MVRSTFHPLVEKHKVFRTILLAVTTLSLSPCHSAGAVASQLVRNGRYEAVDRKSSRIVFQKVSGILMVVHLKELVLKQLDTKELVQNS